MSNLLNIAKDDTKPLYIDPSDVTGVQFHVESGKQTISIHNPDGQLLWMDMAQWNIEAADVIDKLRNAGVPLVHFPVRWPGDNDTYKEYDHYINPHAVTFATVTEVTKAGHLGAIVGVRGVGWEESYNTKLEELAELLAAVRAVKSLKEYGPDVAHARWYNAAGLYIDPKSVSRIVDSGHGQIDVSFDGSGSLDVQVKQADVNDIVNDMPDFKPIDENNLREIFNEAHRRKEEADKAARFSFSNDLAAANGNLISIPSSTVATHISREDIGWVSLSDDREGKQKILYIQPQKTPANQYPQAVRLWFDDANEAVSALKALSDQAGLPPAPEGGKMKLDPG